MNRELLQQALDALKFGGSIKKTQARAAIEAELAKREQEPVAWMGYSGVGEIIVNKVKMFTWMDIPLYTSPPRKPWVGLTQDEIEEIYRGNTRDNGMCSGLSIALEVQLKLKEKNNAV